MNASPEIISEIIFEYRRTRSPFKVARQLGLDVNLVWEVVEQNQDQLTSYTERNGGWGRVEMQKHMVGRRRVASAGWDNSEPKIAKARADYEAGIIEMATARDGAWLILYAIPRKKPKPRPNYFKPELF